MIFVDSSVWIDYFRGVDDWRVEMLESLFGENSIVIGDLVLTKVLQGFDDEKQVKVAIEHFKTVYHVRLGSSQFCIEAANNYRFLRTKGYTVRKTIDSLIATMCIKRGFSLLHNDRDFVPFETYLGLRTVKRDDLP